MQACLRSFPARALFLLLFLTPAFYSQAQQPNWQNKDLKTDSVFGISTERAYKELLKKKKPHTVLVAVIDSGIDTAHEDLKAVIWINPKEIPGNGADDDHNGYIDDTHGWDFIGGPKGDVDKDNLEMTRLIREKRSFYDSLSNTTIPPAYQASYQAFRKMEKAYDKDLAQAKQTVEGIGRFRDVMDSIVKKIGKDSPTIEDFRAFQPTGAAEKKVQSVVIGELQHIPDYHEFKAKEVDGYYDHYKTSLDYELNTAYDPRPIVGDDYNNSRQKDYGNNDVCGPDAHHGTHVAGIIGATRGNGIGLDGIADHVQIMSVRAVPDGDERDKDVANAIRYAVDNGAKVINMSFGKGYSKDKAAVDEAVKYAMSKDVLLVHAAGNDGKDLDDPENVNVPNKYYADSSGMAGAWIQVSASGPKDDSTLVAGFSNYGRSTVDVFAPGVQIYSSIPGNKYAYFNGTSMATPVVVGLAALIREYYPKLTAVQVKDIIMRTVVKRELLKDKCVSGGVVNAYDALQLASRYKK
jgi:subtilisin family serine protease